MAEVGGEHEADPSALTVEIRRGGADGAVRRGAVVRQVVVGSSSAFAMSAQWTAVRVPGALAIGDLTLIVAACAVIATALTSRRTRSLVPPLQVAAPAALLVMGDVVTGGDDSSRMGLILGGSLLACWLVVPQISRYPKDRSLLSDLLVWSAVLNATVAAMSALTHGALSLPGGPQFTGRECGLSLHPNQLALSGLIGLALVLFERRQERTYDRWLSIPPSLGVFVLGAGIAVSGSRAAVACAIALCLYRAWTGSTRPSLRDVRRIRPNQILSGVVIAAVAGPAVALPAASRLFGLTDFARLNVAESDANRFVVMRRALGEIRDAPWTGAGSDHLLEAHDLVVQVLAAGGIIMLLAMVPLVIRAVWPAFAAAPSARSVAVLVWLVFGLVQNALIDRFVIVIVVAGFLAVRDPVSVRVRRPDAAPFKDRDAQRVR